MPRRPTGDAAVRSRRLGVLHRSQPVEAGGPGRDHGPLRPGVHHPLRQRPLQVRQPVGLDLEPPQGDPRGARVGDQRHLRHARAPSAAAAPERQIPGAGRRDWLHTGARAVQRRERGEERRSETGASAEEPGRSLLQLRTSHTVLSFTVERQQHETLIRFFLSMCRNYEQCLQTVGYLL